MNKNLPYPSVTRVMEMTSFRSEVFANAAIATLKWLDDGAPHRFEGSNSKLFFDMRRFVERTWDSDHHSWCGTTCCMAGAMSLHIREVGNTYVNDIAGISSVFGVDIRDRDDPLTQLFYPMDGKDIINKTPLEAAEALRNYLFTGEVKWK